MYTCVRIYIYIEFFVFKEVNILMEKRVCVYEKIIENNILFDKILD